MSNVLKVWRLQMGRHIVLLGHAILWWWRSHVIVIIIIHSPLPIEVCRSFVLVRATISIILLIEIQGSVIATSLE